MIWGYRSIGVTLDAMWHQTWKMRMTLRLVVAVVVGVAVERMSNSRS